MQGVKILAKWQAFKNLIMTNLILDESSENDDLYQNKYIVKGAT